MGFVSFAGRVLFAAAFLLSAYQEFSEFGVDGGPAAKTLSPQFNTFVENVSSRTGIVVPHIELKHVIATTIALKGLGGLLFILSSSVGAVLLEPDCSTVEHHYGSLACFDPCNTRCSFGGVHNECPYNLFYFVILLSSTVMYVQLLYLAFITPIVYDFYNYDIESAEFVQLFIKFTQNWALVGALLFFLGMKNSIPKRPPSRKKAPKSKTN